MICDLLLQVNGELTDLVASLIFFQSGGIELIFPSGPAPSSASSPLREICAELDPCGC